MAIPVTRTKILLPRRRPDLFTRQRLLDSIFDLLDNRLIILAAPAGYGKTSLLVDLANHTSMPFCWLALDALDRDFKRFVTYLVASISHRFPKFGTLTMQVLNGLSQVEPDLDPLLTTMVNEAYDTIQEHFAIVLDDYHFVDDQSDINRFLGRLIQEMDENCHLIVASRTLLSLPDLPLMVARAQVGGLGFDELAFSESEIRALAMQNYRISLSDEDAQKLVQDTEGWITGLLLSAQSQWQDLTNLSRLGRISQVGLYEYLAQQVLGQQPEHVQTFLLQTSLLEEFDAELCELVLGQPDARELSWSGLMETILRSNLFVLPVGEKGLWLRYHHLFRDFLQTRLHETDPLAENRIIHRLADVYAQKGEWERAYLLYQRQNRIPELVDLIERVGSQLQQSGRLSTLAGWIDALPPEILEGRPGLLSLRGSAAVMLGEVERGLSLLNHAVQLYRNQQDPAGLALTLSRRSHTHRFLGDLQASLSDADEALKVVQTSGADLRSVFAESTRSRGICLFRLGRSGEAIECLKRAAGQYDAIGNLENLALTQIDLGIVYRNLGEFKLAGFAYEHALSQLKRVNNIPRQAAVMNNLGVLYQFLGEYDKAGQALEQSLEYARLSGFTRMQALALSSIGDLYRALDAPEAAINAYTQAYDLSASLNDRFLRFYLTVSQAACERMLSHMDSAWKWLEIGFSFLSESRSPMERGIWHMENGRQLLARSEPIEAIDSFQNSYESLDLSQQRIESIQALLCLADAFAQTKDEPAAALQLTRALRSSEGLESTHYLAETIRVLPALTSLGRLLAPEHNRTLQDLTAKGAALQMELPSLRRKIRRQVSVVPFAAPRLVVRALGRAQVQVDGKTVTNQNWQAQVARDMLFLLLSNPEGMTREDIGEVFWPEAEPSTAKMQYKNTIYRMRRALGQEVVILHDERYSFNHSLDYEYDVEIFLSLVKQARAGSTTAQQISAYESAIRVYKGPYLPDVIGSWVIPIREQLEQTFHLAAIRLIELLIQSGDLHTALKHCQDLLANDPSFEEAHRLAMRIHAALGNRADVVRQFERCEQTLLRELNLPPSPQTRTLYESLIR